MCTKIIALLSLLSVNLAFGWWINIVNRAGRQVNVHIKYHLACKTDNFYLTPGESKSINAGWCFLQRIDVESGMNKATFDADSNALHYRSGTRIADFSIEALPAKGFFEIKHQR